MPKKESSISKLATTDIAELRRELAKRESVGNKLAARRDRLLKKVAEIEKEMAALGVIGKAGVRVPRAKNAAPLVDVLAKMLKGKEMGIPAIVEGLPAAGYVSQSPNFRTMVNVALLKKSHFKRTGRGVYTAKG